MSSTDDHTNYPDELINEYFSSFGSEHVHFIMPHNNRVILRKDYNEMAGKVKLISCGSVLNELGYAEFIGAGLLTGMILEYNLNALSVNAILQVIDEISTKSSPGILFVIQNYIEYRVKFTLVKQYAEEKGYNIRLLVLQEFDNSVCTSKRLYKQKSPGLWFLYKVAGAMAEEGKTLNDICITCNKIIDTGKIINIYHEIDCQSEEELTNSQMFYKCISQLVVSTQNNLSKWIESEKCLEKTNAHQDIAILISHYGLSQILVKICTSKILCQVRNFNLNVRRMYTVALTTLSKTACIQASIIILSNKSEFIKYLDTPVSVFAWPNQLLPKDLEHAQSQSSIISKVLQTFVYEAAVQPRGPVMTSHRVSVFLKIVSTACDAIIACSRQLDIIDTELGNGDCGTILSCGATKIQTAIQDNKILGNSLYMIFMQMSTIMQDVTGLHSELYSLYFRAIANSFCCYSDGDNICIAMWLKAFEMANSAISEIAGISIGDGCMLDALVPAQLQLVDEINKGTDPIDAFGSAVNTAQICAMKTRDMPMAQIQFSQFNQKLKHPDPGAHAVGIWMRGAYEAVKLRLRH